jgi:hypothetical protein
VKVKDLIEQLKGYEDFEVTTTVSEQRYIGRPAEHCMFYHTYAITGICDIAHSDKIIDLDNEYKG